MEVARPGQVHIEHLLDGGRLGGEDEQPIGEEDRLLQLRGDEQDRVARLLEEPQEVLLHQLARHGVEPAERLVHQHDLRVVDERAGELAAPLHATGELRRILVLEPLESDLLQEPARLLSGLAPVHAPHVGTEHHVLERGHPGEQRRFLEHDEAVAPGSLDALPVDEDLAGARLLVAGDEVDEGALAAARGADHDVETARLDVEGGALDHHLARPFLPEHLRHVPALDPAFHQSPLGVRP